MTTTTRPTRRHLRSLRHLGVRLTTLAPMLVVALALGGCPDATQTATQCAANDLIAQCPVGSSPVLGARAEAACGGSFELKLVEEAGAVTGQCQSVGTCEVLCQYQDPCPCGVAELSIDRIVCAECADQSCGDGRCDGTERAECDPADRGCVPCAEDCGGATCGDGDCTADESPTSCPQDCALRCQPNEALCVGTLLQQCSADGSTYAEVDCGAAGMLCAKGECVQAGACGNAICEAGEDVSCPQDCAGICTPSRISCEGNALVTCSADGQSKDLVDCGASEMVCAAGACRPQDVCGNRVCEAGEDASCPQDCAAECGNDVCENGEQQSCPGDCVVCGDGLCGAGEQASCPQDCGICVPSETLCLGDLLRVCNANGTKFEDIDCRSFDQACLAGHCVAPGVCGNGACEAGELDSCDLDCAVVCGDGSCQPGETFSSCSQDCAPVCGDESCNGDETAVSCPSDCLQSCGNGSCDPLEDRGNCPNDCGFCGDQTCDDGYESPSLNPPGALISCLADCVVTGCSTAADCNDGISCTTATCVDGACAYTPTDDLCGATEKCIKFSGCCADADSDGYADVACGGSDCDDSDALVHPGAYEACGAGDRNCNGVHRPALGTPKALTSSFAYKDQLRVAQAAPGTFYATWTGVPEAERELQYMIVDSAGTKLSDVATIEDASPSASYGGAFVAYDPATDRAGVAWTDTKEVRSWFTWIDGDGDVPLGDAHLELPVFDAGIYGKPPTIVNGLVYRDGQFVVGNAGTHNNGGIGNQLANGWHVVSAAGGVTKPWGAQPASAVSMVATDTQIVGLGTGDQNAKKDQLVKATLPDTHTTTNIAPESANGECILGWDDEALVHVCSYDGELAYNRLAPNGASIISASVTELPLTPKHLSLAKGVLGIHDTPKVGVIASEADSNLYLFVRDQDGSEILSPGLVAGGASVKRPHVFHDGDNFIVFYLARQGDVHQLYQQVVTCE